MAQPQAVPEFTNYGTGDHPELADYEIIKRRCAIYDITIKITWDGGFVEILDVQRNDVNRRTPCRP